MWARTIAFFQKTAIAVQPLRFSVPIVAHQRWAKSINQLRVASLVLEIQWVAKVHTPNLVVSVQLLVGYLRSCMLEVGLPDM